ncbi:hypothetical protein OIU76_020250 [Salix suchowensis]|nr:hypothetical protein OIU76_020250 [Salix suchowensis]
MLKLGLGLGFMILLPIFVAIAIVNKSLSLISILMICMGICGLFGSLLYFILPKRRPVEVVLVEGEGRENNSAKDSSSVIKKHRIDCYLESTSANIKKNNSSVIGECSGISRESGGVLNMALGDSNPAEIDEDLHSRQLAVYGRETMRRLFASNVLVSGMQGLGVEIVFLLTSLSSIRAASAEWEPAKNLVLAGVKSVTLHDEGVVELWDLSSNFIFSENDVGKNKALASVQKLQELNNAVVISTLTTELTKEHLSKFQAVVLTDVTLEKAIEFNDYCHDHKPPISFIKAEVRGLFGSVFCDFGPEFTVFDVDGEEPHAGIIAFISNDNPALVSCVDDERLEFQDGDLVVFSEVKGMTELNDGKPRKIKNARAYSFTLEEDTSNFGIHEKGGIATQVKEPKLLNFKTLREAIKDPGDFLLSDFSKFDRPPLLHLAFQALDKFVSEMCRFPVAGSEEDAQKLVSIASLINENSGDGRVEDINPKLLRHFAFGARAVLNPMASMFGGIVGQEVVKACSGKFHPLFQFFYFDSLESLPTANLDPSEFLPLNSRYDAQISVFGSKLQKKLEDANLFVEKLTITDDDVIEKSNLSRQFLFRDWNIGQAKSTVAASAAALINPRLKIEALQNRVNPETENVFDDTFWENLTVVVNALDNVNARLYVDQRCLYFQKPLLESGTLGAKCNTQMVIPHLTENYGASRDPPEKQAPMCTVHSFPHNINHCLTWALSEFEGLVEKTPAEVNAYLSNPVDYTNAMMKAGDAQSRETLESVLECLEKEKCETFQDCIMWARLKFEDDFANRVMQLIYSFPEDASTSTGAPFWSAPKRFPHPLQFSTTDPSHLRFVMAASVLRAETFGIPVPDWVRNPKMLAEAVDKVVVPDFQPREGVRIETDEKSTNLSNASVDDAAIIHELIRKLEQCRENLPAGFRMKSIQFEKLRILQPVHKSVAMSIWLLIQFVMSRMLLDDDTNYHMDLIAGLANMRARNYSIPEVDKLKAKFIAGRIIPAIATSTALATGLVCLELYKVLDGGHKLEGYRNTFANLALPLFSMAEPVPPKHRERMDRKVVDLAREVADVEFPAYRRHFDVVAACDDDEGNDVDIPTVSIYFR